MIRLLLLVAALALAGCGGHDGGATQPPPPPPPVLTCIDFPVGMTWKDAVKVTDRGGVVLPYRMYASAAGDTIVEFATTGGLRLRLHLGPGNDQAIVSCESI